MSDWDPTTTSFSLFLFWRERLLLFFWFERETTLLYTYYLGGSRERSSNCYEIMEPPPAWQKTLVRLYYIPVVLYFLCIRQRTHDDETCSRITPQTNAGKNIIQTRSLYKNTTLLTSVCLPFKSWNNANSLTNNPRFPPLIVELLAKRSQLNVLRDLL